MSEAANGGTRTAWQSVATLAGSNYLVFGIRLLAGVAVARILGPELKGTWNGLALIIGYSVFYSLGAVHSLGRELPLLLGGGRVDEARAAKDVGFSFALVTHAAAAALIVGYAWAAEPFSPLVNRGMIFAGAVVLFDGVSAYTTTVLRAEQRFGAYAIVNSARGVVYAVAVVFGAWRYSLEGVYVAALVSSVAAFIPCWFVDVRERRWNWNTDVLRVLLRSGIAIAAYSGGFVLFLSIDRLVVLSFVGTTALGLYSVGLLFFQALMVVPGSIMQFVGPQMLHRFGAGKGDLAGLKQQMGLPLLLQSSLIGIVVPLAIAATPTLIEVVLPAYRQGILPAQILCLGTFGLLLSTNMTLVLSAKAHFARMILSIALALCANAGLSVLAIWFGFGISGVAVATLLAYLVYGVVLGIYVPRHYFREGWQETGARLWRFLWPLPICALVVALGQRNFETLVALALGTVCLSVLAAWRRGVELRRSPADGWAQTQGSVALADPD